MPVDAVQWSGGGGLGGRGGEKAMDVVVVSMVGNKSIINPGIYYSDPLVVRLQRILTGSLFFGDNLWEDVKD